MYLYREHRRGSPAQRRKLTEQSKQKKNQQTIHQRAKKGVKGGSDAKVGLDGMDATLVMP
jgi:hypothetical protein